MVKDLLIFRISQLHNSLYLTKIHSNNNIKYMTTVNTLTSTVDSNINKIINNLEYMVDNPNKINITRNNTHNSSNNNSSNKDPSRNKTNPINSNMVIRVIISRLREINSSTIINIISSTNSD